MGCLFTYKKIRNFSFLGIIFSSFFLNFNLENKNNKEIKNEIICEEIYLEDKLITKDEDYNFGEHYFVNYSLGSLLNDINYIDYIEIIDEEFDFYYGYSRKMKGFMGIPNYDTKYIWSNLGPNGDGTYNEEEEYEGIIYKNRIVTNNGSEVEIINQDVIDHYDEYRDRGWGSGSQSGFYFSNFKVDASIVNNSMLRFDIYVGDEFQGNLKKSEVGKIEKIKVFGYEDRFLPYDDIYLDEIWLNTKIDSGVEYRYAEIKLDDYIDEENLKNIESIEIIGDEFILRYTINWKEKGFASVPNWKQKTFRTDEGPGDANNSFGYNEYPEWSGIQYNEVIINSFDDPVKIVSNQIVVDWYDEYKDIGWGSGSQNGYGLGEIDVYFKFYNSNLIRIEIYDDTRINWIGDEKHNAYILNLGIRVWYDE